MTRIALALLWLIHFLPRRIIASLGERLGLLMYYFGRGRITKINLALCFPERSAAERIALAKRHFRAVGRSALELGLLWWGPLEQVRALVRLKGREHLDRLAGQPVILLAPHFVGLDMGGARVGLEYKVVSMYSRQKNSALNRVMLNSRLRFGDPVLFARQDGLRPLIKQIRAGLPFYYLPDMDFGAKDALFVPFFGVPAATVTALSRLVRLTGAKVVPCITRQLPDGYETQLYPAWEDYPGASIEDDTRRMNAFIEQRVRAMPEQYFWVHKRFKTRPPGEPSPYKKP